jgi:hypothetical protein
MDFDVVAVPRLRSSVAWAIAGVSPDPGSAFTLFLLSQTSDGAFLRKLVKGISFSAQFFEEESAMAQRPDLVALLIPERVATLSNAVVIML